MATLSELREFKELVDGAIKSPTADFSLIIKKSLEIFDYTDLELADLIEVSRPTVTRWKNGNTAPHQAVRKHFLRPVAGKAGELYRRKQRADEEMERHSSNPPSHPGGLAAKSH